MLLWPASVLLPLCNTGLPSDASLRAYFPSRWSRASYQILGHGMSGSPEIPVVGNSPAQSYTTQLSLVKVTSGNVVRRQTEGQWCERRRPSGLHSVLLNCVPSGVTRMPGLPASGFWRGGSAGKSTVAFPESLSQFPSTSVGQITSARDSSTGGSNFLSRPQAPTYT